MKKLIALYVAATVVMWACVAGAAYWLLLKAHAFAVYQGWLKP